MPENIICLSPEVLQAHLTTLENCVEELNTISVEVKALTFGATGSNESAGPCSGRGNQMNTELYNLCIGMAGLIGKSTNYLKSIQNDIVSADAKGGT